MSSPHSEFRLSTHEPGSLPPKRRLFRAWWRRQSPARQDRFATLGPLVSVLLFMAAIIAAFWYLRIEEVEREQESIKRDTEVAQQQIRLRLIENQEQLVRLAREVATGAVDPDEFVGQATTQARERPELVSLSWLTAERQRMAGHLSPSHSFMGSRYAETPAPGASAPAPPRRSEPEWTFETARELRLPVYSRPYTTEAGLHVVQVQVPLVDRAVFAGTVVAEYSVEALLRYFVPTEVANRHGMMLLDADARVLASTVSRMPVRCSAPSSITTSPWRRWATGSSCAAWATAPRWA
jgi:hypothetical protein